MPSNVTNIDYGRKLLTMQPKATQPVELTPHILRTRKDILDMAENHVPYNIIAMRTRTSGTIVLAVIATYLDQFKRQAATVRLCTDPEIRRMCDDLAAECWDEFSVAKAAA